MPTLSQDTSRQLPTGKGCDVWGSTTLQKLGLVANIKHC